MLNIIENISASRASIASIGSALLGQISTTVNPTHVEMVNIGFQHAAWVVAILAGVVSIVNGTRNWFKKKR